MEYNKLTTIAKMAPIMAKIEKGEGISDEDMKLVNNLMKLDMGHDKKTMLSPPLNKECQCIYDLHVKRHIEDKGSNGQHAAIIEHFQVFGYDCFILMLRGSKTCNNCYIVIDDDDIEMKDVHEGDFFGGQDCEITYESYDIEESVFHTTFNMKEGQRQIGFDTQHISSPYIVTPEYLIGICIRFLYYCKKAKKEEFELESKNELKKDLNN